MTTTHLTPNAPEAKPGKTTLLFTALALATVMVSAAGGGAAFMLYHEFSATPDKPEASSVRGVRLDRLSGSADDRQTDSAPMTRPVAAEASDRSDYRFADNTILPPAEARRVIAAWTSNPVVSRVPAPLEPSADTAAVANRPPLNDSGSHYFVDAATGQVVGVDGSVSAAIEARQAEAERQAEARRIQEDKAFRVQAVPVEVAVQTPPEIRVASAVQVRAALPVNPDDTAVANDAPYVPASNSVQYVPVRRAQPVAAGRSFNAASFLASEDNRPVLRAQPVNPTSRAAGYRHDFQLPDQGN